MTDQGKNGTAPSGETRTAEETEARTAHEADRAPTAEEEKAAPGATGEGTAENFDEMAKRGANVKGEGELP